MIKGTEVKERVEDLLKEGKDLESVLFQVTQENLKHLPDYLKNDPQEVSAVLSGVQFYTSEVHPEFTSGATTHDIVLLRLIPKTKTERFIQEKVQEAEG